MPPDPKCRENCCVCLEEFWRDDKKLQRKRKKLLEEESKKREDLFEGEKLSENKRSKKRQRI